MPSIRRLATRVWPLARTLAFAAGPFAALPLAPPVPAARAQDLVLTHGSATYRIDAAHGALAGAQVDGEPIFEPSSDHYTLMLAGSTVNRDADETADRVLEVRRTDGELQLGCANDALGVRVEKTYWIDAGTGWLFKRTVVRPAEGADGLLVLEGGLSVPDAWWRGAVLWHPVWHETASPFDRVDPIRAYRNLNVNNTVRSAFALYQPGRGASLVHWQWGGESFCFFEGFPELPAELVPESVGRGFGSRLWPRRWLLGAGAGFLCARRDASLTVVMAMGVQPGSPLDFLHRYGQLDAYRRLTAEPLERAPAWVRDTVVDDAIDHTHLSAGYERTIKAFLEHKHSFGFVQTVYWGAFPREFYIARPEDSEPDSHEDPAALAELLARLRALSPRLKVTAYTHLGHAGTYPSSNLAKQAWAEGWVPLRRDLTRVQIGADYDPHPYGATPVGRHHEGYRQYLRTRAALLFDHLGIDLLYTDTAATWGRVDMDWRTLTSARADTVQRLCVDLLEVALERGRAWHMNYPVPLGNTSGFSEFPWYLQYEQDWRLVSGRLALQQALNVPGRRLYMAGHIHPELASIGTDESLRAHLNYMTTLGIGFSLLDVKRPGDKRVFYREAPPYVQAAWEIRDRALVPARVSPDFYALEGDTEAHAWRATAGYGLVTLWRHRAEPGDEVIGFDARPLGLEPDRPALLWRLEMADPRAADFRTDGEDTPVRRLAGQRLLEARPALGERVECRLALPADNPVILLATHSPAVLTAVGGRSTQYWLPAAYGATTTGRWSPDGREVRLSVSSPHAEAAVRSLVPPGAGAQVRVVGIEESTETPFEHRVVEVDGQRFVDLVVPAGETELLVR